MSVALVRARVLVGDGTELEEATIELDGARIAAVRPGVSPGSAATTIDLEGRTVVPGLIDLHTHMAGGDNAIGYGDEATSFKMGEPLIKAVLDSVGAARRTLHAGVTTAREIGCRAYIDVFLREAQRRGEIEAPRLQAAGPGIAMTGGHGSFWEEESTADSPAEVIKRVRQLVANGVDWVKVVSSDGPETLGQWWTAQSSPEEIQAAFTEARRLGRRTASHSMGPEAIGNVAAAGVDTIEHGWYLDEASCRLMVERGTVLVPTLGNVVDIIHKGPSLHMPWAAMMAADEPGIFERISMAVSMGVRIAMGSDCGGNEARLHGSNVDELVCYVRCGMTPMQALVSATRDAAVVLGLDDLVGTIEPGKAADLVLVEGDPLADVSTLVSGVAGVVQDGRVVRDDLGVLGAISRGARG